MLHVFLFILSVIGAFAALYFVPVLFKAFNATMKDSKKIEAILDEEKESK